MSDRRIDAIRAPIRFAGPGSAAARLERLGTEFARLLGAGRIFVRLQGGEHFMTAHPDDSLQFPQSGESRYQWEDRGDGIFHGYLKADL